MPNNTLTLAVAGSRKTQSIVEACKIESTNRRILVLTYTTANQNELKSRLKSAIGDHPNIEVCGWFSFLIKNFVKPYLPFKFPGKHVQGFDFESPPRRGTRVNDYHRYFNTDGSVLKSHLPQLVFQIEAASHGQGINRVNRLYDKIFIDEVQDLCGYDLEILDKLMMSSVELMMVGDVRQAILATNPQEIKNGRYRYMGIWDWFKQKQQTGGLEISHSHHTWRCRPEITLLADSLFDQTWGFTPTESLNNLLSGHDGIFFVKPEHVPDYIKAHNPLVLRNSRNSGANMPYDFMNIGLAKGLTRKRVLILPTTPVRNFLLNGAALTSNQAAHLYVAVTRAEQSVAFIMDSTPGDSIHWSPID